MPRSYNASVHHEVVVPVNASPHVCQAAVYSFARMTVVFIENSLHFPCIIKLPNTGAMRVVTASFRITVCYVFLILIHTTSCNLIRRNNHTNDMGTLASQSPKHLQERQNYHQSITQTLRGRANNQQSITQTLTGRAKQSPVSRPDNDRSGGTIASQSSRQ
jgi:hypothetical protein